MTPHLYKPHLAIKAAVLCICDDVVDCRKLESFGYTATTVLDESDGQPITWACHCTCDMIPNLHRKRIILFPHQDALGHVQEGYAVVRLVDHAQDLRIVQVPSGVTVAGFLRTITGAREAAHALHKLVEAATPLTSWEGYCVYVALRDIREAVKARRELGPMELSVKEMEAKFRLTQIRESERREKLNQGETK